MAENQSTRACRICGVVKPENGEGSRPTMCRDCFNAHRRAKRASKAVDPDCVECGDSFQRVHNGDKVCSMECRHNWNRRRRGSRPLEVVACRGCGEEFNQTYVTSNHCSSKCMNAAKYRAKSNDPEFMESKREYARRYRARDPELTRARDAENREKYRDSHRIASARWARENRYRITASWRKKYPEKHAAKQRRRTALIRSLTPVSFTHDQVMQKMTYWGERCWMCGGDFQQVDHVKPLAAGGLNILANLRPACQPCNNAKRAKWLGASELHRFVR